MVDDAPATMMQSSWRKARFWVALASGIALVVGGLTAWYFGVHLAGSLASWCGSFALDATQRRCRGPAFWAWSGLLASTLGLVLVTISTAVAFKNRCCGRRE